MGGGGFLLILSVGALFIDPRQSLAIAAGGMVSLINFVWLRRHLGLIFTVSPRAAPFLSALKFLLRFAFLGIVVYLLLVPGKLPAAGLLTGLSAPVAGIMLQLAKHLLKGGST